MMLSKRSCRDRAFTLIELLVVVAIIAVLIAMLLPSLSSARTAARVTACQGQVHQIGLAFQTYINDHKDLMPNRAWFFTKKDLESYLLNTNDRTISYYIDEAYWQNQSAIGNAWLLLCPDVPRSRVTADPYYGHTYAYDQTWYDNSNPWRKNRSFTEATKPSRTSVVHDSTSHTSWDGRSFGDYANGRHGHLPSLILPQDSTDYTNPRNANVLFADSHAEFRTFKSMTEAGALMTLQQ